FAFRLVEVDEAAPQESPSICQTSQTSPKSPNSTNPSSSIRKHRKRTLFLRKRRSSKKSKGDLVVC
ncbi:predicted protein, partial [Nematostella vectensis]